MQRRPDADRHADDTADDQRGQRQVDRVRQHGADIGRIGRPVTIERPKSPDSDCVEEVDVLPPDRLVEAELRVQRGDALRCCAIAEDGDRGIARHDADDQEHQCQHRQQCRDRREQPTDDVEDHVT